MKNSAIYILFFLTITLSACKKEAWVFDSPANENLELPLLLNINGKACALDIESKSFRFPIAKTPISNFSAYFEFQSYSSVKFEGILLQNNQTNNLGNIAINTPYELEFTTDGEVNTFYLYFSSIPTVQLIAHDKIRNEPKSLARIIVNYKEENKASTNSFIGIEYRGISSLYKPKKSMGFELLQSMNIDNQHALSFFDKKENSQWVLDAMYIDEAKGRNKTSLELWQTFPSNIEHLGTSCEYVEVFLNYESLGLFSFCEALNYEFLSLNSESILITGKHYSENTTFSTYPKDPPTGPYWDYWEQKVPDTDLGNNWAAFEALAKLISEKTDEEFIAEIANHIDLDNLIDYFLFVNICNAYDDVGKNWFFLKKSNTDKFVIVPWDFDSTWGRSFRGEKQVPQGKVGNALFYRLLSLNPNNYKQKLKSRWEELKHDQLSAQTLISLFDANFEQLNQSNLIEIDNNKWDRNINLLHERQYLNTWIFDSWNHVDNYISSM